MSICGQYHSGPENFDCSLIQISDVCLYFSFFSVKNEHLDPWTNQLQLLMMTNCTCHEIARDVTIVTQQEPS